VSLLELHGLRVGFEARPEIRAGAAAPPQATIDGVSLSVAAGETLALVGESGSGKTLTALAVMGVLPPRARVLAGQILFRGRDLARLGPRERRALYGRELAMSFQEPLSALNPVLPIGEQIAEGLRVHRGLGRRAARARTVELLEELGLLPAAGRLASYPHELSGGQRQRALLAVALAADPALLIADEPTSALDVSLQAEILALLERAREQRGMALLLISHDLGLVARHAGRVAVMYAGRVVEQAPVDALLERPAHPYTALLLRARPALAVPGRPLRSVPSGARAVPAAAGPDGEGCRFRARCPLARARCDQDPPLAALEPAGAHLSACHFPAEAAALARPEWSAS